MATKEDAGEYFNQDLARARELIIEAQAAERQRRRAEEMEAAEKAERSEAKRYGIEAVSRKIEKFTREKVFSFPQKAFAAIERGQRIPPEWTHIPLSTTISPPFGAGIYIESDPDRAKELLMKSIGFQRLEALAAKNEGLEVKDPVWNNSTRRWTIEVRIVLPKPKEEESKGEEDKGDTEEKKEE